MRRCIPRRLRPALLLAGAMSAPFAAAQIGTTITYQGELEENGTPKAGVVDLRFDAFPSASGGTTPFDPVILDGVALDGGRFAVQVPFESGVFLGGALIFIEVGVREDAAGSAGDATGFTTLSPRQEVTPTPFALRARSIEDNRIGSSSIVNGSVTSSDIADGSITASDANTTSTSTGLQRRITGPCLAGKAMSDIAESGTPGCVDTVSAISTPSGSGLASSRDPATGIVTMQLSESSGQQAVFGECEIGKAAISAINADGTVRCLYIAASTPNAQIVIDSTGDVGRHLSTRRIDQSARLGQLAVAYYDDTNNRLKFVSCASVTCSPAPTPIIIDDPANDVGQFVSLANVASKATMAYYDATADDLKLAICENFNCSSGVATIRVVDSVGDVGRYAEVMDVGGRIGIAYHDSSNNGYKFALCNDSTCTAPVITVLSGLTGGGSSFSDIAAARLGSSSRARFALISQGSAVLMVNCLTLDCATFNTQPVSSSTDIAPPLSMITISQNGNSRHWVSHARPSSPAIAIRHCRNSDCSDVVDSGAVGIPVAHSSMAPTEQGVPVVVASRSGSDEEVIAIAFTSSTSVASQPLSGTTTSGGDIDVARISPVGVGMFYYDTVAGDLIYQRCARDDCSEL